MRLIDADVLRDALGITGTADSCKGCKYHDKYGCACNTDDTPSFEYVCEMIDDAPTVEPERKKGKWIYEVQDRLEDETDDGRVYRKEKRWKCSECGYDKGFALYKPKDKFCVECGAKMER